MIGELKIRDLQHEIELIQTERKLAEYIDLIKEREIKAEEDLYRALRGFRLIGLEKWGYKEPPKMRRIMPKATTDWDFSATGWELATYQYVSAPSSWRPGANAAIALCKYTGTYPLDEGRIVSWMRLLLDTDTSFWWFRKNNAPGSCTLTSDCYVIRERYNLGTFSLTACTLSYYSGAVLTHYRVESYLANGAPPTNVWDKRRATWWVSAGVLVVRLERFYGGAWIKAVADYTDSANRFTGNANRRCGIGGVVANNFWDDTEIWGP